MSEQPPVPGAENLSMGDQMRAAAKSGALRTSPVNGAVENPRREFVKNRVAAAIAAKAAAAKHGA